MATAAGAHIDLPEEAPEYICGRLSPAQAEATIIDILRTMPNAWQGAKPVGALVLTELWQRHRELVEWPAVRARKQELAGARNTTMELKRGLDESRGHRTKSRETSPTDMPEEKSA